MIKLNELVDIIQTNLKYNPKSAKAQTLFWGLTIFCIIFFIRPFGISDEDRLFLLLTALSLSISSAFLLLVNLILIKKNIYNSMRQNWKTIHELLFLFIVTLEISLIDTFITSSLLGMMDLSISTFVRISSYVIILHLPLIIFQTALSIFIVYQKEMTILKTKNEYLKEIEKLNNEIKEKNELLSLNIENDKMTISRNNIISISSYGNYLKFFLNSHSGIIEIVKRDSLTSIESQLNMFDEFIRCHRSHIININHVEKILGTSKKAEALFKIGNLSIPIARSSIKKIIDIFQNRDIS